MIGAGQVAESPRCIGDSKTKHVLASLDETLHAISPIFVWVRTLTRHLYSVIQIRLGLGRHNRKPIHDPSRVNVI